jgi:hypothetical protein
MHHLLQRYEKQRRTIMAATQDSKLPVTPEPKGEPVWWIAEYALIWREVEPTFRGEFERLFREQEKAQGPDNSVFGRTGGPRNVDVSDAHLVPDEDWTTGMSWDDAQLGLRFGVGARAKYQDHARWSDDLEAILRDDWGKTYQPSLWQRVKRAVRRGFEHER